MTSDDHTPGGDFEQRLRAGLADAAHLADTSRGPDAITGRARRRDRMATAAGVLGSLILVAVVALVVVPDRGRDVVLDGARSEAAVGEGEIGPEDGPAAEYGLPGPVQTATVPGGVEIVDPPIPGHPEQRPEGRLVAAIHGRLVLTDLDGRVEGEAAWQPTTTDPIAEVVTDGDTVVTWQPPCTLEAGSLQHGTIITSLTSEGSCNGPAAIDEETGTIMWMSAPAASPSADQLSVAYHREGRLTSTGGGFSAPGLLQPGDRVVGMDRLGGESRVLIRRTLTDWIEVMALPVQETEEGGWEPTSRPGGGEPELRPAFVHLDGYVPLDAVDGWVLDAPWDDVQGLEPRISGLRVRPAGEERFSMETGGMEIDAATVWFDADGPATIWGQTGVGNPQWQVSGESQGWSGETSGGVTAAAIIPGSITSPSSQPEPADPPPDPTPTEGAQPDMPAPEGWAQPWCDDEPMIGVATAADHDEPFAICADGRTPQLVGGGFGWSHPSIAAGAFALAAEGGDGHAPAFTALGARVVNHEGMTPALAQDGGLAWTTRSLDGTTIHVASSFASIGDPAASYDLPGEGVVSHLSWARDSRFLFVTTRSDAGHVGAWVIDTTAPAGTWHPEVIDPDLTPIEAPEGQRVLALAGEIDTTGAGVLLTVDAGGTVRIAGVLVADGSDPHPHPRVTTLAEITGEVAQALTTEGAAPTVTAVGLLTPDADLAWAPGDTISWLVGDGQQLWHVPAGGPPTRYRTGTAEIAIDPAVGM